MALSDTNGEAIIDLESDDFLDLELLRDLLLVDMIGNKEFQQKWKTKEIKKITSNGSWKTLHINNEQVELSGSWRILKKLWGILMKFWEKEMV